VTDPGTSLEHPNGAISIRRVQPHDREWILGFLLDRWGSERQVAYGQVFYPADHPGFVALVAGKPTGLLTHRIDAGSCEVTLLDSGRRQMGIGSALLEAVEIEARQEGCRRIWLVTTNDNLDALRFYQRRGFALSKLRPGAVVRSRELKPEIPLVGEFGIPLRDELELEKPLS
jgi:GNAT superfamily N-acetyltransferase